MKLEFVFRQILDFKAMIKFECEASRAVFRVPNGERPRPIHIRDIDFGISRYGSFCFFPYSGFVEIEMESVLLVFLSSFLLTVNSHPRNSDLIPKDFYKRQILQPIPGYIPVYIKADGEPIIRSEKINHDSNAHFPKASETDEDRLAQVKSANTAPDRMNTEIHITASKNKLPKFSETSQRQVNSSNGNRKSAQTEGQKLSKEKNLINV